MPSSYAAMNHAWVGLSLLRYITCQTLVSATIASSLSCLDDCVGDVIQPASNSIEVSLLQTSLSFHVSRQQHVEAGLATQASHVALRRQLGNEMLRHSGVFDDEVETYARLYHEQFFQRSMLFFLHVSKAAGTVLCEAALRSGCRTSTSAGNNCHLPGDWPSWFPDEQYLLQPILGRPDFSGLKRPDTCAGLSAAYFAFNLTIEGNENFLIEEGICSEFWNVMVARDPMRRLMSNLAMLAKYPPFDTIAKPEKLPSANVLFERMPTLSNNYNIRVLLGAEVFLLPFGSITSAHLEEAKRVIERFDVVLVPDEDNKTVLNNDINVTLGIDVGVQDSRFTIVRDGDTDSFMQDLDWTDKDWESVNAANALDIELVQYARTLRSIDQQVFRHPAFSKVSATMSRAPCGYLSK
jgi:hypothetical protein